VLVDEPVGRNADDEERQTAELLKEDQTVTAR